MNLQTRKPNRLKDFDYSENGYYFITICTDKKQKILCNIATPQTSDKPNFCVGEGLRALPLYEQPKINLTKIGKAVNESIKYITDNYFGIAVDKYVIMRNHIHLIIKITGGHGDPPLQDIIRNMKSYTTKIYGKTLWQRSFYDHIIRGESDYLRIWEYIDTNPQKWTLDKYYVE